MSLIRNIFLIVLVLGINRAYGQQDVDFHLNAHYFVGKKILKVYQNIESKYVWILASSNEIYRLNAATQSIDDLTSQFSSLRQYKFIDIASPDDQKLFVATNSTEVVLLNNGAITMIGASRGLIGNVNSIGLFLTSSYYYNGNPNMLRIGTDKGWANYDINNDLLNFYPDVLAGTIYEQNFRIGIFANSSGHDSVDPDAIPIDIYTASLVNSLTIAAGYIWRNGVYGHPITAFYSFPNLYFDDQMENYLIYLFWGSENGLFENRLIQAANQTEIKQFLSGIQVNKINNILGLTSFGSQFFKSNLLIGTEKGLYFSNSTAITTSIPPDLFLTHFDDLGNVPVNDVQVEVASISQTYPLIDCEDGIWVGTNDGLYFIKPDYGKYNNMQNASIIHFKDQTNAVDILNFCSNVSAALLLDDGIRSSNIQWYKDSKEIPGANTGELDIINVGEYYAVVYDPCADIHVESNHLKATLNTPPSFTFNYPDKLQYCIGTPVKLQANGSETYQYRWYTNGVLNGDVTPTLAAAQSGKYKVEVSDCMGSWVASKEVEVDFTNLPVPVIMTDKAAYCVGDQAILTISVPADPSYDINWYKDNVLVAANANQASLVTTSVGNYTVSVVSKATNTDGSTCSQSSAAQSLVFNPLPTVSISKIIKTTLCDGQTVELKASYSGGTVLWSTGETTDQISVTTTGNYKVTITSPAADCIASASADVTFLPSPVFNVSDATICTYTHQTVTLTAPPGFSQYAWNGEIGEQTYKVTQPQTVTLTVTDVKGCQVTKDINVVDQCPIVSIPNTFTPNGDGINDTWKIAGLENDPTVVVRVFTRYGSQVFESRGYGTAWDGSYHGKKLSTGTYYYIITAVNGNQKFSGSVTIIY